MVKPWESDPLGRRGLGDVTFLNFAIYEILKESLVIDRITMKQKNFKLKQPA